MDSAMYQELVKRANEPAEQEKTIEYIRGHLFQFVKASDRVLICFEDHSPGTVGWLMEQAVKRCGGVPIIWGPDRRWKTLLQQAFYSHASTIIGLPLIILGLTKLQKQNGIPLKIRHVVTAGYPCLDWMIDGIVNGLDCSSWGSFGLGQSGVIAGFSCGKSRGVHLREDVYGVDILGDDGTVLPVGSVGQIALYLRDEPEIRLVLDDRCRLETASCGCGRSVIRLMDLQSGDSVDPDLLRLGQYLNSWTSVLDCCLKKGKYGLEMELIVFPGEKLPKLPSVAKQVIRPWNPKHDEPFLHIPAVKNGVFSKESH